MTSLKEEALVLIGQVVKTQGNKGEIRVHSSWREKNLISPGMLLYFKDKEGSRRSLTVESLRYQGNLIIFKLQEVKGRGEAQKLVGSQVYVSEENLPPLPPDEFYWFQLFGLKVYTEKGTYLGILQGIIPTGSNDVFVVRHKQEEYLIPAIAEVVREVKLKEKTMIIRPLAGLLPHDDL